MLKRILMLGVMLGITQVSLPVAQAAAKKNTAKKTTVSKAAPSKKSVARSVVVVKTSKSKVTVRYASRKQAAEVAHYLRQAGYRNSGMELPSQFDPNAPLELSSNVALIVDEQNGTTVYSKNPGAAAPIASITKLMTAIVTLDRQQSLDETITISEDDMDTLKGTGSRLRIGVSLTRREMLHLALMSSENRAAHSLARTYPGGEAQFVAAMNRKAAQIGMTQSRFVDPTGLNSANQASAEDLVRLVRVAHMYPEIREFTTSVSQDVPLYGERYTVFRNSNALVKHPEWEIGLSKTGFISEAGRCLVMQAKIAGKSVIMVLLDSAGKNTRIVDAIRIKKWLENKQAGLNSNRIAQR